MKTGITGEIRFTVTEELTAKALGSGELPVLATPALVAKLEEAAWRGVAGELEDGQSTVGSLMNLAHTAPTPLGLTVRTFARLEASEGRKLTFAVWAEDEAGLVAEGTHERFIIDSARFLARAEKKRAQA